MTGTIADASRYPVVPYQYYARTGSGHTPSRSVESYWEDCTTPWVTTADVKHLRDGQRQVLDDTEFHISELGMANSAARLHPAGTVVLSRTASVGFAAIMGRAMATSQDFVTWTSSEELDPRYLLWALRAMKGEGDFDRLMYGSTHKTIYVPDLQQLRGPLPSPDVQRRIANYLDTETARIDTLIAKNERVRELLHERESSALVDLFARADDRVPLRYLLAQRPSYGILKPEAVHDGVPVLRIVDVAADGKIAIEDAIRVRPGQSAEFSRTVLRAGDVVVSVVGTLGRSAVINEWTAGANVSRALARLVPSGMAPELLAGWIRSPEFDRRVDEVTAGTAQRVLNMKDLVEFRMPVFLQDPDGARLELENLSATTQRATSFLLRQNALLGERRQALITAAVTGELEV